MSCLTGLASVIFFPCAVLGYGIKYTFSLICCCLPSGRVVGIFSRSAPDDYDWLTRALKSSNLVKESRSVFISNREEHHFRDAVQDCDFTILYHTKNRGRINITNVTDSLYDEQLQYMSTYKGRVNVIVVADDLDMGDYETKRRIINFQPDIMKYSQDLILVTSAEKRQPQLLDKKLQHIGALISAGSGITVNFWDYLVSMTDWVHSNVPALLRCAIPGSRRRGIGELDEPLLV